MSRIDVLIHEFIKLHNGEAMNSREIERALLKRCAAIARGQEQLPRDQREANFVRVAGMILVSKRPTEAARLMASSSAYFEDHPSDLVLPEEVVRKGWVISLPRLRAMLIQELAPPHSS